jgi:multicomponent Na+:H+ antiporter subunit G
MSFVDILIAALLFTGAVFMLVASLGVLRMPDLFLRMSASTKAATLGTGSMLIGVALHFGDIGVTTRALATIVFLLLTAPVAAHMLGRAGYFTGVELCDDTVIDELHGQYNLRTHLLDSCEPVHKLERRTPVTPPETPEPG